MLDSKNIMLDIAKASTSGPASSAVQVQDHSASTPAGNSEPFAALMGDAAAKLKAAKSGNSMPLAQPPSQQGSDTSSQASLHSRTLKGGTALIIGGAEPTDEGLIAFAQAQGMDPTALGLLSGKVSKDLSRELAKELGAANDIPAIVPGAATLNIELQSLAQSSPATTAVASAESKLALPADKFLSDQQRLQLAQSSKAVESPQRIGSPQPIESPQRIGSPQPIDGPQRIESPQPINGPQPIDGSQRVNSPQPIDGLQRINSPHLIDGPKLIDGTKNTTAPLTGDASAAHKNSLPETANTKNSLAIKANSITTDAKLAAQTIMPGTQSGQPEAGKLRLASKIADAFIQQHRDRQGLPPTKLDAINLAQSKTAAVTSPTVIAPAPPLAAGLAPAPLFIEGQAASSATAANLSSEPPAETEANEVRQDALRRQDDFTQLSRQLTDALGKRLTAQIQRGSWHVEMELHPKTLGRVEVQLEMKNGELEARFIAANATTRDLINEGMPRLREAFQEHGTETAYRDLGAANQGASDGNSTASNKADEALAERQSSDTESDGPTTGQGPTADGLDVLV